MEPGLGRRAEPAEVADALKTRWQDVLEETMEEALGSEAECLRPALIVAVREGDVLAIVGEDALGTEGGAIHIRGQILEGRFTSAHRLHVGDPVQRPDASRNLEEELRMISLQNFFEPGAKTHSQCRLR